MKRRVGAAALVAALQCAAPARAQTVFEHDPDSRVWLSGQINVIGQAHGSVPARYDGPHSFRRTSERKVSQVVTLFSGVRLPRGWEIACDVESAGGRGLSDAFGLAGYTNLDVVRNPTLGSAPYLARLMVRKIIPLSHETQTVEPTALALAPRLPARRLELRAGKMGMVDFFDLNPVGSDSHLQFTNWTVDNNGAYDYAADTRGYTYAALIEYDTPRWSIRGAEALMPTVANGIVLDWSLSRSRGENLEWEVRLPAGAAARLLAFVNHANMGSYAEAIRGFSSGRDPVPDIERHRRHGRAKYGAGINVDVPLANGVRAFARSGWNSGDAESFAYTEVNDTFAVGADTTGSRWRRASDRAGAAFVSNGLSSVHREYLRLGGLGFLLGDGTLSYGRESILESYYTAHLWRGVFASGGVQYIARPGYNRDRGPVLAQTARLHVDF